MPNGRRWYPRRWDHPARTRATCWNTFIRGLGLPRSLQDVRIGPEHFDRIAEQAMGTPWIPRNPRKIDSPAQGREICLLAAYENWRANVHRQASTSAPLAAGLHHGNLRRNRELRRAGGALQSSG